MGLVMAVIWLDKNKVEQNQASESVSKVVAMENMTKDKSDTTTTTRASMLKMKYRHLLVSKDFLM